MAMPTEERAEASEDRSLDEVEYPAAEVDAGKIEMSGLTPAAHETVRRFIADATAKGGASPADVADLYTTPEVVGDAQATEYLDRRFVHGEMPDDWRALQDRLADAQLDLAVGASGAELLARLEQNESRRARSIFDDPDDLDDLDEEEADRTQRIEHATPTLGDLDDWGRRAIERHVVAEVMHYGLPPAAMMQLREDLLVAGDDRSLQYLDAPFELGTLPQDWEELRSHALRARARVEARGEAPGEQFSRIEAARPDLDIRAVLNHLEESAG